MTIPQHFRLTQSQGDPWITERLLKYSSKLPPQEALKVTKKLLKEIERVSKEIEKHGIPSNLQLAYVHHDVQTGVFLKPTSRPIKPGALIGVYTGLYELVDSDTTSGTSYAYDVAQGLSLKKNEIHHVVRRNPEGNEDKEYSIQTNAFEMGNFTRYINHSSSDQNIEAIVSKFPDGRMEIILFALHTIHPGEQLLSCYGGQYWKALEVIPNDMKPDTYLLTKSLKAKLSNPLPTLSHEHKKLLLPLRHIFVDVPSSLEKNALFKAFRKKKPKLLAKHKKEVDAFEEVILERGLPRKWNLSLHKGALKVSLKEEEKALKKGQFIGTVAGSLSLKPSSCSFLLFEDKKRKLFLDCKKEGNFLSRLPKAKDGNVAFKAYIDKEDDSLILLAFATRAIKPKEALSLIDPMPLL